jgi:hypothetical protein
MNASKPWYRSFWRVLLLTLTAIYSFWYMGQPRVEVYYSDTANSQLDFIWNTTHSIYRGTIGPGGATGDSGHIFPDESFFMFFEWTASKKHHCLKINPKWPTTRIYIRADGTVDSSSKSGTDLDRLSSCLEEAGEAAGPAFPVKKCAPQPLKRSKKISEPKPHNDHNPRCGP